MIAATLKTCLHDFDTLYNAICESETRRKDETLSQRLSVILDRFKLWAHGFGVTEGHLDTKLQTSTPIRQFVDQELHRLSHALQEAFCGDLSDGELMLDTLDHLERIVLGLFDIGPALQRPQPDAAEEENSDIYLEADIQRVEMTFPKAKSHPELVKRLAEANFKRRQRLQIMQKNPDTSTERLKDQEAWEETTIEASISTPPSKFSDISFDNSDSKSEAGSDSSYASSVDDEQIYRRRVPPPPVETYTQVPFECPYCFGIQTAIKSRSAWKYVEIGFLSSINSCCRYCQLFSVEAGTHIRSYR